MKKPPPGLVTSRSKPPRHPHPKRHPHPQRHHPGRKPGPAGVRATNPLLPGRPLPAHKHKAPKHKKAKKPVKRKLALGEGVACCAAEALAASLRLAGVPVGDEDVLALYWCTAADADAGATILGTLEAASEFGLAGMRPRSFATVEPQRASGECMHLWRRGLSEELDSSWERERPPGSIPGPDVCAGSSVGERSLSDCPGALILGVTLPGGPHALCLDPSGAAWSWGELYDPGDLEIEEAWLVDWEV